jgi:aminoglycoside phosphotransferase (APT) family kinase protein
LVLADRNGALTGTPFFVMGAVDGRVPLNTIPSYHSVGWVTALKPEERSRLVANSLRTVVAVHDIDWEQACPFLDRSEYGAPGLGQYLTYMAHWYRWMAKGRSIAALEAAMEYLRNEKPSDTEVCLAWGDARVGNMIYGPDQSVQAALDWEMATLGPPEMDVAWWLMFEEIYTTMIGTEILPGMPDAAGTVAEYEALSGRQLHDLEYYDVLAFARMAITCCRISAPGAEDDPMSNPATFVQALAGRPGLVASGLLT